MALKLYLTLGRDGDDIDFVACSLKQQTMMEDAVEAMEQAGFHESMTVTLDVPLDRSELLALFDDQIVDLSSLGEDDA